MNLILSGDENNAEMPMTDAGVNHLRRLLAWLICEYNLSEEGQRGLLMGLDKAVAVGADPEKASEILSQEVARVHRVPLYIRQAVKMLAKAIRDHDARTGVIEARTDKTPGS